MQLSNLKIVDALDTAGEQNLICLYDKTMCDCCICAGLYVESVLPLSLQVKATIYQADPFMNYVNNNAVEPTGVDISSGWFSVDSSLDYSVTVTGAAGTDFTVWRF